MGNVYRRALYNNTVAERVALYSALLCEAIAPDHPAHFYFATRCTRVLDTFVGEFASLRKQGLIRPDVNVEHEAAWFIALWDGLRLRAPYTGERGIPERLLLALDDLFAGSVPGARRAQILAAHA